MVTHDAPKKEVSIHEQVLHLLQSASAPLSQVAIRKTLHVRNETLTQVLRELEEASTIVNLGRMKGWVARASCDRVGDPDSRTHLPARATMEAPDA